MEIATIRVDIWQSIQIGNKICQPVQCIVLLVFSFLGYRHVGLNLDSLELEEKIVNSFLVLNALLELKKVSVRLKLQIYIY